MRTSCRKLISSCAAAVLAHISLAAATEPQPYPSRPVRLIVPSPAGGGGSDLYARLIGKKLGEL
ncbi:MAG: tripartite tricarboxylate transporter substrate binding protein, partial [Burkholderiales bacterium]